MTGTGQPVMRGVAGASDRGPIFSLAAVAGSLALLAFAVLTSYSIKAVAPLIIIALVAIVASRTVLAWRSQLAFVIGVILFIPIKRYTLPAGLPFHLEIYRVVVALVCVAWLTSALIDPRVRLRRSGFDRPLVLFLLAVLASLVANIHRVSGLESEVLKRLMFFASFILVFYMVVSLVRRPRDIDFLVNALAGGGTVVAFFALVEWRTNYNVFDHLKTVLPILHDTGPDVTLQRAGRLRVSASAQHPIALGASLVMLLPLAVYRARVTTGKRWWVAAVILLLGALASGSRTGLTMLLAVVGIFAWLRFNQVKKLWPALIPLLLVVHIALPGTLGSFRASFFPKGGLIAQEHKNHVGAGRLATLGPALRTEWRPHFAFGEGFQTRVTTPDDLVPVPNGPILDDQWLGVLLETGIFGALSLAWLFVRAVRKMGSAARGDPSPSGWLLASLAASVAAYGVGMFTYDSFSFIQVTFLLFIMLGLGSAVLAARERGESRGLTRQDARRQRTGIDPWLSPGFER